jgi:hypothetical protein
MALTPRMDEKIKHCSEAVRALRIASFFFAR